MAPETRPASLGTSASIPAAASTSTEEQRPSRTIDLLCEDRLFRTNFSDCAKPGLQEEMSQSTYNVFTDFFAFIALESGNTQYRFCNAVLKMNEAVPDATGPMTTQDIFTNMRPVCSAATVLQERVRQIEPEAKPEDYKIPSRSEIYLILSDKTSPSVMGYPSVQRQYRELAKVLSDLFQQLVAEIPKENQSQDPEEFEDARIRLIGELQNQCAGVDPARLVSIQARCREIMTYHGYMSTVRTSIGTVLAGFVAYVGILLKQHPERLLPAIGVFWGLLKKGLPKGKFWRLATGLIDAVVYLRDGKLPAKQAPAKRATEGEPATEPDEPESGEGPAKSDEGEKTDRSKRAGNKDEKYGKAHDEEEIEQKVREKLMAVHQLAIDNLQENYFLRLNFETVLAEEASDAYERIGILARAINEGEMKTLFELFEKDVLRKVYDKLISEALVEITYVAESEEHLREKRDKLDELHKELKQLQTYLDSLEEAMKGLIEANALAKRPIINIPESTREALKNEATSIQNRARDARNVLSDLDSVLVKTENFEEFATATEKGNFNVSTVNHMVVVLHRVLYQMARRRWIKFDPPEKLATDIAIPREAQRDIIRAFMHPVLNSIKYYGGGKGHYIRLTMVYDPSTGIWTTTFKDNGSGMDKSGEQRFDEAVERGSIREADEDVESASMQSLRGPEAHATLAEESRGLAEEINESLPATPEGAPVARSGGVIPERSVRRAPLSEATPSPRLKISPMTGMATTASLLKPLGGRVRREDGPGVGTTITIKIDTSKFPHEPAVSGQCRPPKRGGEGGGGTPPAGTSPAGAPPVAPSGGAAPGGTPTPTAESRARLARDLAGYVASLPDTEAPTGAGQGAVPSRTRGGYTKVPMLVEGGIVFVDPKLVQRVVPSASDMLLPAAAAAAGTGAKARQVATRRPPTGR